MYADYTTTDILHKELSIIPCEAALVKLHKHQWHYSSWPAVLKMAYDAGCLVNFFFAMNL